MLYHAISLAHATATAKWLPQKRSTQRSAPPTQQDQAGAVLLIGLIILGVLLALVTVGTRTLVTMEQISANAQKRAVANYAAENVVIQAINDQTIISPLINEARYAGQSVKRTIAVTPPNPDQSGNADVVINTLPTIGFSADTLTTYNITIGADATAQSTDGQVTQSFMRIGAAK